DPARINGAGLNFGIKLPTGDFDVENGDGALAERSLQPGTGTTDLLVGGYFQQALPLWRASWFAQVLYQHPLNSRDNYEPGSRLHIDIGARYEVVERVGLMLQVNTEFR